MSRSIQQLPNNSGTTSVTEVYTSTGFSAGDPVYFQNGDYKSPANLTAPSSVNFSFGGSVAVDPNGQGGILAPSFTYAQMQTGISGGSSKQFASVLTNGNIVQAWTNYSQAPSTPNQIYFRIITPSGTVVVGPTVVSATFTNSSYSAVSVTALVGGGFAVGWINSAGGTANSVNYAIYDNTGLVVTAATQDTSFSLAASYVPIDITSLANGGFAIAAKNTSSQLFLRAYSSTGVGAYATINTGITGADVENSFALTSRSDSSVFVCDRTSTTQYQYALFNSGGTAIVSATAFAPGGTLNASGQGIGGPDASVQTDGTTIVIGFPSHNGTNNYPAFRFLPASNTLSAETIAVPVANSFYQTTYNGGYLSVRCLSSNNFILFFSDGYGNMQYAFYNSTGTCISGTSGAGAIPIQVTGGFCGRYSTVTLLESSGFVYAYWTSATNQQKPVQQVFCTISTSNYAIQPRSSAAGTPYIVSGIPAGASIPSTVNPNSLSFYSTTSSTVIATNAPATVMGPISVNSSLASDAIASCTLPNGNFVVAWRTSASSPYTITAQVYSPSGTLLTTATVGTSTDSSIFTVRVAALSGGGFVVAHTTTSSIARLQVFSSGYSAAGSTTINTASYSTSINFDIAGLTDNNFVFAYQDGGGNCQIGIYASSLTRLQLISPSTPNHSIAVAGNHWGGFAIAGWNGSNGVFRVYVPTATNTWTASASSTFTMGAFIQSPQLVATESGLYIYTNYAPSNPRYDMFNDSGTASVTNTGTLNSWPLGSASNPTSNPLMGIGLTGNGNVVIATSYNGSLIGVACLPAQMTFNTNQVLPYQQGGTSNVTMFSNNYYNALPVTTTGSQPRVTSGLGNNCVITYISSGSLPTFAIVNGTSISDIYNIVAGVTPSALTPIVPTGGPSVITGALAGIAVTSATAGSTGQVANNGQVLLSASYTSTATGAFDSTSSAVSGVKGTFNGRSVNLQGNS
jgi:hypothetical protein